MEKIITVKVTVNMDVSYDKDMDDDAREDMIMEQVDEMIDNIELSSRGNTTCAYLDSVGDYIKHK